MHSPLDMDRVHGHGGPHTVDGMGCQRTIRYAHTHRYRPSAAVHGAKPAGDGRVGWTSGGACQTSCSTHGGRHAVLDIRTGDEAPLSARAFTFLFGNLFARLYFELVFLRSHDFLLFHYFPALMAMVLGLSASARGNQMVSTPFLKLASTLSGSTMNGSWMVRLKEP